MKSSFSAESSDDDLEDRDDDADHKLDVEEEESLMAVTMAMPSSASSSYATTHSVKPATAAAAAAESSPSQILLSDTVCTAIGECEMCPSKWQVMMEKEEQTIKGEYESCIEYGRRMPFECTVLFQANDSMEKIARNVPEFRSCQFTDSDEQFRMLRMQIICLLVGIWSLRNVRKQRVVSASLFDQRRLRIQGSSNSGGVGTQQMVGSSSMSNGSYSSRWRKNSMELTQPNNKQKYTGYTKVPKSPAPDFNGQDSSMQAV